MFTNRISKYLTSPDHGPAILRASDREVRPQVPKGFVALPGGFATPAAGLYQMAYLAAQSAVRDKLLQLLRSRSALN